MQLGQLLGQFADAQEKFIEQHEKFHLLLKATGGDGQQLDFRKAIEQERCPQDESAYNTDLYGVIRSGYYLYAEEDKLRSELIAHILRMKRRFRGTQEMKKRAPHLDEILRRLRQDS